MLLLRVLLRSRGQSWVVVGPISNHGRQRPLTICIDKELMSHGLFCCQGKGGPMTIESIIVDVCVWPLVLCQPRTSTVDEGLDFKGSANKKPAK